MRRNVRVRGSEATGQVIDCLMEKFLVEIFFSILYQIFLFLSIKVFLHLHAKFFIIIIHMSRIRGPWVRW